MMRWAETAIAVMILFAALPSFAEESEAPVASSYQSAQEQIPQEQPFKVIVLGTRSGSDIELIRTNVEKLSYVSIFVPAVVSQRHIEFEGRFAGEDEALIADIESLAQDRYEVKSRKDRNSGLVITLRKIQPAEGQ
jgi:hypothetical protein